MIVVDLIIVVLTGYGLFKGLQKGFILSVVSLAALVAGIYGALRFSFFAREILETNTEWNPNTITVSAFFITFMAVLISLHLLGKLMTGLIETLALGFVNKLAGAVFGGLKMILIVSVFLNLFQKINHNNLIVSEEKLSESVFYYPIEKVTKNIFPLMTEWYQLALDHTVEGINEMKEK